MGTMTMAEQDIAFENGCGNTAGMKRFCVALFACCLVFSPSVWAEGSDDQYIGIYSVIKQGDLYLERGQGLQAVAKYGEAQAALKKFQVNYPDWNVNVVKYRLNYLAARIADLSGKTPPVQPPTNPAPVIVATPPPVTNTVPAAAPVVIPEPAKIPEVSKPPVTTIVTAPPKTTVAQPLPADSVDRLVALQDQVAHLEADKAMLEAKLKEALAARPAASDPRELAKAQDRIKNLEKENDLLKFSLAQAKTNSVAANMALLEQTRKELAESNRKVAELTEANTTLTTERDALQGKIKSMASIAPDAAALRTENEILKKELAELKTKAASGSPSDELARKLMEAQTQLAAVQSDKEILRIEKGALEDRIRELSMKSNSPAAVMVPAQLTDNVTTGKIKELELQRDELEKSLVAATREIYGKKKGKETATRIDEMTRQLSGLRARIDTLEARQTPYTPEELQLLDKPDMKAIAAQGAGKSTGRQPGGRAAALMAEAEQLFASQQLPAAEAKFNEALKADEKSVPILLGLAAVQGEQRKYDDLEKTCQSILAVDANNERAFRLLGGARLQQNKFDDALEFFGRAAQSNPTNTVNQYYIGVTLDEKGLRGPAESAFRKAIQLDPGNGPAHAALAFVYITQQPPLAELARWHYQKALALGCEPNPGIQKVLYPDGNISAR